MNASTPETLVISCERIDGPSNDANIATRTECLKNSPRFTGNQYAKPFKQSKEFNLREILRPLSPESFFSDVYTKHAVHLRGESARFESLFNFDDLNSILNASGPGRPPVKLVIEGRAFTVQDSAGVIAALRQGASLIIDGVNSYSSKLRESITLLANEIGEKLDVNLYLSQPDQQGFLAHYDGHDVLILQISGYKKWKVFEPESDQPSWFDVSRRHGLNTKTPYLDVTLRPGDVLYVPRGHWHDVTAHHEPSLHLTIGIKARTLADYFSWTVNKLVSHEEFQKILLPSTARSLRDAIARESFSTQLNLLETKMKDLLISIDNLAIYDAYSSVLNSRSFEHDLLRQMQSVRIDNWRNAIFSNIPSQIAFISFLQGTTDFFLSVNGRRYRMRSDAEGLVRFMFSTSEYSASDLMELLHVEDCIVLALLDRFIQDGVLKFRMV